MMREPLQQPRRSREAGTSTVEMAIVLPLLLMLVFAIGEFGLAFTQWQTLTNATREGARAGIVFRGPACSAATVKADVQQTVGAYVTASGIQTGSITTTSSGECAGSGTPLTVSASVPYQFQILPGLAGLSSQITLAATSVMRNE